MDRASNGRKTGSPRHENKTLPIGFSHLFTTIAVSKSFQIPLSHHFGCILTTMSHVQFSIKNDGKYSRVLQSIGLYDCYYFRELRLDLTSALPIVRRSK